MLLNANESALILIDTQEKLFPFIHNNAELLLRCEWMLKVASLMNIPILISEQYPEGLGETLPILKEAAGNATIMTKTEFSCTENNECLTKIEQLKRKQVILIGIEAHVCVLQTAFGLQRAGKSVYVVADAVESRRMQDKVLAIERMQAAGIYIISSEMALFEWCRDSKHPHFKMLSARFLREK